MRWMYGRQFTKKQWVVFGGKCRYTYSILWAFGLVSLRYRRCPKPNEIEIHIPIYEAGFHRIYAHGRVNDPMAKLQFLRVGWGGVGWGWWHSLNLNTCWMLRNCVCLVIAHMLDATQLCLPCHCTYAGCYATVFVLSMHTCWMLRNCVCLVNAHMLDATQLCLSCHCMHAGCDATVFVLSLHTCWMLRHCVCLVIALGKLAHKANNARRWWQTTSFFRRMVPIRTNSKQNAFVKARTHGKNGTKWTYEPTDHKWKSTPLQHFVHLQQNDMWISPRVAITAVT